jgi:hypothetical protein
MAPLFPIIVAKYRLYINGMDNRALDGYENASLSVLEWDHPVGCNVEDCIFNETLFDSAVYFE